MISLLPSQIAQSRERLISEGFTPQSLAVRVHDELLSLRRGDVHSESVLDLLADDLIACQHQEADCYTMAERALAIVRAHLTPARDRLIEAIGLYMGWEEPAVKLVDECILPVLQSGEAWDAVGFDVPQNEGYLADVADEQNTAECGMAGKATPPVNLGLSSGAATPSPAPSGSGAGNGSSPERSPADNDSNVAVPATDRPDGRTYPDLLSDDEKKSLRQKAEGLWDALEENNLGGFSGINRPFLILHEFKEAIEQYGRRDVGLTWSANDLKKAKPTKRESAEPVDLSAGATAIWKLDGIAKMKALSAAEACARAWGLKWREGSDA